MDTSCSNPPVNPANNLDPSKGLVSDDNEIVTEERFGSVVKELHKKLVYVLLGKVRHDVPEDRFCLAEDMLQEAWNKILLQIREGKRIDMRGIFSYAVKTGYFELLNYRRKYMVSDPAEKKEGYKVPVKFVSLPTYDADPYTGELGATQTPHCEDVDTFEDQIFEKQVIEKVCGKLDERERTLVLLALKGHRNFEIAQTLNISEANVAVIKHRMRVPIEEALKTIRQEIEGHGHEKRRYEFSRCE
jgi:RNA polymerase sigma factor (sigma-70 family)